jgi:hypothetical protein
VKRSTVLTVIGSVILVLSIGALGASLTAAQGPPEQSSNTLVRNLSGSEASVIVQFVNPDGSIEWSYPFTLTAYGSKTVGSVEYGPYLPATWIGSQVIYSSEPVIATMVNWGAPRAHNSYEAFEGGSTPILAPSIHWNPAGQASLIAVQNVDTSDAEVEITYYDRTGVAVSGPFSVTIPPGASEIRDAMVDCATCGTPPVGSVKAVSTNGKELAGAVIENIGDLTYSYSTLAAEQADTTILLPSVHRNPAGQFTWTLVQNQSDTNPTVVTITYYDQLGNPVDSFTKTLAAKGAYTFATDPLSPEEPTNLGNVGNAVVTSTAAPIVATVVERAGEPPYCYNGFNSTAGAQNVLLPSVHRNPAGQYSWILVQNTSDTTATDVTISYYDQSGTEVNEFTKTLGANGSYTFATDPLSPNEPTGLGNVGSALVESDTTDILVVVVEGIAGILGSYSGYAQ